MTSWKCYYPKKCLKKYVKHYMYFQIFYLAFTFNVHLMLIVQIILGFLSFFIFQNVISFLYDIRALPYRRIYHMSHCAKDFYSFYVMWIQCLSRYFLFFFFTSENECWFFFFILHDNDMSFEPWFVCRVNCDGYMNKVVLCNVSHTNAHLY